MIVISFRLCVRALLINLLGRLQLRDLGLQSYELGDQWRPRSLSEHLIGLSCVVHTNRVDFLTSINTLESNESRVQIVASHLRQMLLWLRVFAGQNRSWGRLSAPLMSLIF